MSQENEEWELCKENIRPIKQGRKQKVLKVALAAHPEDIIVQQRQSFENELRTYSGDDPLSVWCEYIKWVEQNFPKGGREGHIKELIERCLSILKSESKYFDDERFIDIMLDYATISGKPLDVYSYMFSNNIGCKSAKLFINWSWELEQINNLKKADEVMNEGLKRRAEPSDKISAHYKDFVIRLADKIKTTVDQKDCESENSRSAFAMLKPQKKNLAPILRTGEAVVEKRKTPLVLGNKQPQPRSMSTSAKVPFKIFDAENVVSSLPKQSKCPIPSDLTSDNYKENERKPSKWNKVKVKAHGLLIKTPGEVQPSFNFHCDSEFEPELTTPRSVPKTSKILTTRCRTPTSPMVFFEPSSDPLSRNMYPKNKIYGGAEEFSLEEIRAAEWFDKQKKIKGKLQLLDEQVEQKLKTDDVLENNIELDQKQPKPSTSQDLNLQIYHSENAMTENNEFPEASNSEKEKSFAEIQTNNQNEQNVNFEVYEDDSADLTNHCSTSNDLKNSHDYEETNSITNCENKLNSNEFDEKNLPVFSKNFSQFKNINKQQQTQTILKECNIPFNLYYDSTNED